MEDETKMKLSKDFGKDVNPLKVKVSSKGKVETNITIPKEKKLKAPKSEMTDPVLIKRKRGRPKNGDYSGEQKWRVYKTTVEPKLTEQIRGENEPSELLQSIQEGFSQLNPDNLKNILIDANNTNADLNSELMKPEHIRGDLTAVQKLAMERYNKNIRTKHEQKKAEEKNTMYQDAMDKLQPVIDEVKKEEDAKQVLKKYISRKKAKAVAEAVAEAENKAKLNEAAKIIQNNTRTGFAKKDFKLNKNALAAVKINNNLSPDVINATIMQKTSSFTHPIQLSVSPARIQTRLRQLRQEATRQPDLQQAARGSMRQPDFTTAAPLRQDEIKNDAGRFLGKYAKAIANQKVARRQLKADANKYRSKTIDAHLQGDISSRDDYQKRLLMITGIPDDEESLKKAWARKKKPGPKAKAKPN